MPIEIPWMFNIFPKELSEYMDLPVDLHLTDDSFNTLRVHKLEDAIKSINAKATEIRYTNNVTVNEVEKLRDFLIEYGFSDDENAKTVALDKEDNTYLFKMVLDKSRMDDKNTIAILYMFKEELSKNVFNNQPVKVHMCDELMNTIKIVEYKQ